MSDIAARMNDAMQRHRAGDVDGAVGIYRELVELEPENGDLWHLLGVAVHQKGNAGLAAELIETAISLNAEAPDYYANLAMVRRAMDDDDAAETALRRAIDIDPGHARSHSNLAGVLRSRGDFSGALAAAETAVALNADDAEAHNNLGNALKDGGRTMDAVASYRRAIAINPDFTLAHWNLSLALASLGELQDAFNEMAWRWQWSGFPAPLRDFTAPAWRGEPIEGATILIHAEQGLGDAIHFVRYAALVRERGARVIIEAPPGLVPLIEAAGLADQVIKAGEDLPKFNVHAPFLDLPRIFATSLETIPDQTPYLAVDETLGAEWRQKLAALDGLKIGLNWLGNPASPVERFRGLPLDGLGPLAAIPGVSWVSLQKGPGGDAMPRPAEFDVLETGEGPLQDTAALIDALDLVITSDTAVAHLAGALGKPTWLLLHQAPDWRWMTERPDSPWYPSLKLYRQEAPGDWTPVIAAAANDLAALARP
ncbi:MAG: glycosyltransferase family protein [Rhodospirillaceae bacterium]|jgi:Flp pilus assembly protein TadD|nr:glycosyltransferase family protein [Rhodospirillaceae bacterium]MBT4116512.1 glycosyltransferase family protein [Rhodospirillaceae bacterium]MBT4670845.1 glycosyltransferase family protein [Rhodospirillaceae bacterium]MBT4721210.1 glycosyltransferase family protein [Rhodospirillaceae bacterium]MBT4748146.1 glycosyltransferase family protein [Rhodospirillaceae bacterium]